MIKVELEDPEELKKWGMGLENIQEHCIFCKEPTRYWHAKTNQPVCPACAKQHIVKDIAKQLLEIDMSDIGEFN